MIAATSEHLVDTRTTSQNVMHRTRQIDCNINQIRRLELLMKPHPKTSYHVTTDSFQNPPRNDNHYIVKLLQYSLSVP